jgi:hypothetical protein
VDEGQSDGALEFVGGIEDELAVGGDEDARDGLTDGLGEFVPSVADREPVREDVAVWRRRGGGRGCALAF